MITPFPASLYKATITLSRSVMIAGRPGGRVLPILETVSGVDKEKLLLTLADLQDRNVTCAHRVLFSPLSKWVSGKSKHEAASWYYDTDVVYVPEEHLLKECGSKHATFSGVVHTNPGDPFYKVVCYFPDKTTHGDVQTTQLFLTARTQCRNTAELLTSGLRKEKLIAGAQLLTSPDGSVWEPAAPPPYDDYNQLGEGKYKPGDPHAELASWLYGLPTTLITAEQRLYAKSVNVSSLYT